ncbi:MAG: LysR family transcriptional regulator [Betaproteobacteria bacterium HGW-Betaproteobacteria-13]|jgi:DNA-binding transcriptional LysR family regulator|uniref:LysR family transcriptional regulator n=1 Tax=Parazoarcus communis TaxID=41977 RepID=A0A2U8H384_9RHOO|nr:LysR substrate-binding domain-containing protein [Parazoarcus communis]AWI80412.1 LysR family transcriptional regulator [Parazoarcus communis]PKO80731.1 MAG: LysR family transcriptional regulator [Betaproteobacteria bacterium HGW-Betaproteobacteria-13]
MELRHLRYFVAVAEELSFTRAAERLHIGQPPLSMQIRDLEAELGVLLFERTRRKVMLTQAGARFLVRARSILSAAVEASEEMRRVASGEAGELRIGFTSSLPYTNTLPDVLYAYRRRYPGVHLQLREMFSAEQFDAIARGSLDIGLVRTGAPSGQGGIAVREIGRDPLRIVINAAHPLAGAAAVHFADLRDEDFITFPTDAGTGLPMILRGLCRAAGFEPRVVQLAREATTQIGLVAAGLGLALLPAPLECVRIPRVRYLPIAGDGAFFPVAVAHQDGEPSPLLRGFLNVLDEVTGAAGGALQEYPSSTPQFLPSGDLP